MTSNIFKLNYMKASILITVLFIAMNFNTYSQGIESSLPPGQAQQYLLWEPVEGENIDYIVSMERIDRITGEVVDVKVLKKTSNNYYRFDKKYFNDFDYIFLSRIEAQNSLTGAITHESDRIEIEARCVCPTVSVLECSYTCLGAGWDIEVYSGTYPTNYTLLLKSNNNAFRYMTHAQYTSVFPRGVSNTVTIYGAVQSDGVL